jgi:hypothetical protein
MSRYVRPTYASGRRRRAVVSCAANVDTMTLEQVTDALALMAREPESIPRLATSRAFASGAAQLHESSDLDAFRAGVAMLAVAARGSGSTETDEAVESLQLAGGRIVGCFLWRRDSKDRIQALKLLGESNVLGDLNALLPRVSCTSPAWVRHVTTALKLCCDVAVLAVSADSDSDSDDLDDDSEARGLAAALVADSGLAERCVEVVRGARRVPPAAPKELRDALVKLAAAVTAPSSPPALRSIGASATLTEAVHAWLLCVSPKGRSTRKVDHDFEARIARDMDKVSVLTIVLNRWHLLPPPPVQPLVVAEDALQLLPTEFPHGHHPSLELVAGVSCVLTQLVSAFGRARGGMRAADVRRTTSGFWASLEKATGRAPRAAQLATSRICDDMRRALGPPPAALAVALEWPSS